MSSGSKPYCKVRFERIRSLKAIKPEEARKELRDSGIWLFYKAIEADEPATAHLGIFIKNVSHLELASKITSFVFDKTGTLTDGLLSVVELRPFGEVSPAELLLAADFITRLPPRVNISDVRCCGA